MQETCETSHTCSCSTLGSTRRLYYFHTKLSTHILQQNCAHAADHLNHLNMKLQGKNKLFKIKLISQLEYEPVSVFKAGWMCCW